MPQYFSSGYHDQCVFQETDARPLFTYSPCYFTTHHTQVIAVPRGFPQPLSYICSFVKRPPSPLRKINGGPLFGGYGWGEVEA
jgi:hypothetical protein